MKPFHIRTSFTLATILLTAIQVAAVASDGNREGEGVMSVLICNPPANKAILFEWQKLELMATKNANGSLNIVGPVKHGDVCIRDIQVWAAFGVFSVTGALCSADAKPLLQLVHTLKPKLTKPAEKLPPGIMASLRDETYGFLVFNGTPSVAPEPDPKSQQTSFMCAIAAGDTR